ncbi:MAG: hypothetical protein IK129_04215, partial [Deltaproteobacteria bacterium]|nr:hypothetical protein [Deltaproteobacteria bacterium]
SHDFLPFIFVMDGIAVTDPATTCRHVISIFQGGPFVHHQANPASVSLGLLPSGAFANLLIQTTCQPEKKFFHN